MTANVSVLTSQPVIAALLLGCALVLYLFLYRGARLTPSPWWAGELPLSAVLAPLVVLLVAAGIGFLGDLVAGWAQHPADAASLAAGAGALLVALAIGGLIARATPKPQPSPKADVTLIASAQAPSEDGLPRAA